ncbi:MAG: hypothetical protein PXX77_06655 [Gallionella sp.]|nr:hypothetical protein [Gallionella sp.]
MIRLEKTLRAWGTPEFEGVFKQELAQVGNAALHLQQALVAGSHVTDAPPTVMIIRMEETPASIRIHAGLFFTSIIAGCSCTDDPTPPNEYTEHCEMAVEVDRVTAETRLVRLE